MNEDVLLAQIFARSRDMVREFPWVLVGPGDDCAAVAVGGRVVVLKTDQLVEGRHFRPGTPAELIAHKALARPLSDLAAAGARPVAALVGAVLPPGLGGGSALAAEIDRAGRRWRCPVVAGDIATSPGPLCLSVSVVGEPATARGVVGRGGAKPGDGVYVTGELGGSFGADGMGRHLSFEPRLAEGAGLAGTLGERLHAMMDISDGLGLDASRLARASGVAIEMDAAAIPVRAGLTVEAAVRDGEDYELLFAAAGPVPDTCPDTGTRITRIGVVVARGAGGVLLREAGGVRDIAAQGWRHG